MELHWCHSRPNSIARPRHGQAPPPPVAEIVAEPAPAHKVSPFDCTELTNIAVLHTAPDTLLAYAHKVSCLFDRHEFVAAMVDEVQLSAEKDRGLLSVLFR